MIDHLTLRVRDYEASKRFFLEALGSLGYELTMEFDIPGFGKFCGLGVAGKPDFWLAPGNDEHKAPPPIHLAFAARDRKAVDAFHAAALAAGGKDNGAPGVREQYHPDYYGAFAYDLDGHNIEACCHKPG